MKPSSIKIHPISSDAAAKPMSKEVGQLSLDIYQKGKELIILAPIAGVNRDDIELSVTDDVLVIKGNRAPREEISEENYFTKECFWGGFSRAIVLPLGADPKKIDASFENHVLEIHIPILEEQEKTKIIKIKA